MYNPSFLLGGSGSLIVASIAFVFIYSNVKTNNIPLAGLVMYALMWVILIIINICGSLIGTSPDDPNETSIKVVFISSIVYFTIVGFMVMLLKLCPNIIRIFDNSISYLIVTQVLPLFWVNTYTEAKIDKISNTSSTTTALTPDATPNITDATTSTPDAITTTSTTDAITTTSTTDAITTALTPDATTPALTPDATASIHNMPTHLLITTFNTDTLLKRFAAEGKVKIQKLLTLLQTVSTFIIMTFSLIVAFLVSNIAIQLTRERKA